MLAQVGDLIIVRKDVSVIKPHVGLLGIVIATYPDVRLVRVLFEYNSILLYDDEVECINKIYDV